MRNRKINKRFRLGPVEQKILLLLGAGIGLGLSTSPARYFKILKSSKREWQKINQRSLHKAIRKLYESKLISCKENNDNTISMLLTDQGKHKSLRYNLEKIKIKKPVKWDKLWRLVIFDIPESLKQGRNSLVLKLKQLGFYPFQKSVFIYPYQCRDEIDFIIEIFNLRPYVRFIVAQETDIDLDLKNRFNL